MGLEAGYGQTPLPADEFDSLLPAARLLLGDEPTKAAVYDLEQAEEQHVAEEALVAIFEGELPLEDILSDHFVRDLHRRLYGDIWSWAGLYRKRELNIGVPPAQVSMELRCSLDTIRYRWNNTSDWTPRALGIACHAEIVRIHPFTDGNGRCTRLLADLVLAASGGTDNIELYDWALDKRRYIDLLREYDRHRDPQELAAFVPTRRLLR